MASSTDTKAVLCGDFEVVSWNLLSVPLCNKEVYPHLDQRVINKGYRWELIKSQLKDKLASKNVVFCFMEVSHDWYSLLFKWFTVNGYACLCDMYDKPSTGQMGVMIAFPSNLKLESVSIEKIGMLLRRRTKRIASNLLEQTVENVTYYGKKFGRQLPGVKDFIPNDDDDYDDWGDTITRNNGLLFVLLKDTDTGKTFGVATYHMPANLKTTTLGAAHSCMIMQRLESICNGFPYVLAGDFNITPKSPVYEHITNSGGKPSKGYSFLNIIHPPKKCYQVIWDPSVKYALQSAYKFVNGAEPPLTTCSKTSKLPTFVDTVDYIFYSPGLVPISTGTIPTDPTRYCPNGEEPSGHYKISAVFNIKI